MIRESTVYSALLALAALAAAPSSFAECVHPPAFGKMPDGARATIEEMKAANVLVKKYVTDLGDYITCVDQEPPLPQDRTQLNDAQKKEQDARELDRVKKHNAAVDDQKAMQLRWHEVLESYKSKHPG